ncbi:HSP20-like chaperone [Dacryopinax primogenitus]|uniref:HSP20-like chaperone n=1 Tax=Dacryopinax primogenitus (strain DJM 731) TaxID=1858805 RepID=M5GAG9_DACPD|nr:HSP20-like chaperone [Dacryopinax primogenitus]EJU00908.1 HSP20-like chaperone [Dacryopinax primogenitus]
MSLINFFDEPLFYYPSYSRHQARRQAAAVNSYYHALARQQAQLANVFSDMFDTFGSELAQTQARQPKTELREAPNGYVLEAELPGVRKEDLEVTITEGGKRIRIKGRVARKTQAEPAAAETVAVPTAEVPAAEPAQAAEAAPETAAPVPTTTESEVVAAPTGEVATAPVEEQYTATFSQSFALPRAVDGTRVVARLEDGVLRLVVPFLEDADSVRVTVN